MQLLKAGSTFSRIISSSSKPEANPTASSPGLLIAKSDVRRLAGVLTGVSGGPGMGFGEGRHIPPGVVSQKCIY